ncbi:aromatic acid exporter family protein [Fervidibacillus albus]|uniref:Aromatic acid exporter family protein n=1 Tax=Fervidibacillus albus TaxID=2980026 RepID=A0A9E8RX99_9BACI|nr:aromatic acid exporter family protein [Fervidibacillus albus]WAA10938.1 aromatic acid exporter family protein [Fervidibacillus albus]
MCPNKLKHRFIGGRILKTGLAAFFTAFICHLLHWPAMFAVITAIVTVEPTVRDSIRKALVRFPAAAIGAAFSVFFNFLFGDSPFTYAFVAFFTIIACHKWKLHDGMVVATLTGVAMISTVHDHYLVSFFIRLGTTSIGIIVSALVNFIVLPPKYSVTIDRGIHQLFQAAWEIIEAFVQSMTKNEKIPPELLSKYEQLEIQIERTNRLFQYQKGEWKYHGFQKKELERLFYDQKKYDILKEMMLHIGLMMTMSPEKIPLSSNEIDDLKTYVNALKPVFHVEETTEIKEVEHFVKDGIHTFFHDCQCAVGRQSGLEKTNAFALFYHMYALSKSAKKLVDVRKLESRRLVKEPLQNMNSIPL